MIDNCAAAGGNPCQNDGSCENVVGDGTYTCTCATGFSGTFCETADVDGCAAAPCANGGSCATLDALGAFACTCTDAYTGATCADTVTCVLTDDHDAVVGRRAAESCNACQQACAAVPGCAFYQFDGLATSDVGSVCA